MGQSPENQEAAEAEKKTAREAEAAEHKARRDAAQLPDVGTGVNKDS